MLMDESTLRLRDGSRIAIIGGGPAGSLFALHAMDFARQRGLQIEVVVFEQKDLTARGPVGCNKCAGILSSRLIHNLRTIHLTLPPEVVQARIEAYVLHLGNASVEVARPEDGREIISIYRGGGPRLGDHPPTAGFDAWLLSEAERRGARVARERVEEVRLGNVPVLRTRQQEFACDLVVLACGVNTRIIPLTGTSYTPPRTEMMAQDELLWSDSGRDDLKVHVYFDHTGGLLFAGFIPKGPYANISLLGHDLGRDAVGDFLSTPEIRAQLSAVPRRLCGCKPSIAVSMARDFYGDRFVVVGDAAVTRLYKDGIGSAFLTARQAAHTTIEQGISAESFRRHYAPLCRDIDRDNRYGRLLFALWKRTVHNAWLTRAWFHTLIAERALPPHAQYCRMALWAMFTGDDTYEHILGRMVSPVVVWRLARALLHPGARVQASDVTPVPTQRHLLDPMILPGKRAWRAIRRHWTHGRGSQVPVERSAKE